MRFFSFFLQRTLLVWSFVLLTILSLSTLIFRVIMPMDGSEFSLIELNSLSFFLFLFLAFFLLLGILAISEKIKGRYLFIIGTLFYLLCGLYLIFHQNGVLRHDALAVLEGAKQLNRGDNSSLTEVGAYFYKYPHQLGLASFERVILAFFGQNNVTIFFVINLVMAISDNFLIWKLSDKIWQQEGISKLVILLSFAFLPHLFFILFVYGLTYGLFFSLLGLYFLQNFLQKRSWLNFLPSFVCLIFAIIIRNNYLILILSVFVMLLLDTLSHHSIKSFLAGVILLLGMILANRLVIASYEQVSHHSLKGEPKIAWIAMGLNNQAKVYHCRSGWYDAYVENVYNHYQGNAKEIEQESRNLIKKRLREMIKNPQQAFQFFKEKVVSTWADSLFQSIWSGPVNKMPVEGQDISGKWMSSIYEGRELFRLIYRYSAILLSLIYLGPIIFILSYWQGLRQQKEALLSLLPLVFLSGGFIFHLIWETKSQYVYPFVYLLIPLSAYGLYQLYAGITLQFRQRGKI